VDKMKETMMRIAAISIWRRKRKRNGELRYA
jgi:hypothetical protein